MAIDKTPEGQQQLVRLFLAAEAARANYYTEPSTQDLTPILESMAMQALCILAVAGLSYVVLVGAALLCGY